MDGSCVEAGAPTGSCSVFEFGNDDELNSWPQNSKEGAAMVQEAAKKLVQEQGKGRESGGAYKCKKEVYKEAM